MSLGLLAHSINAAGVGKHSSYFAVYERHLGRFAGHSPVVIELGIGSGSSLVLWKLLLGASSQVWGIDIDPETMRHELKGITHCVCGDATDPEFLDTLLRRTGPPDIVIDDGSHRSDDMIRSFEVLYPRMTRSGVYLVEDLHQEIFDDRGPKFLDYARGKVNRLNAIYHTDKEPIDRFAAETLGISFYESIAVFDRGTPEMLQDGRPEFAFSFNGQTIHCGRRGIARWPTQGGGFAAVPQSATEITQKGPA